jgi:acetylornithine/N-succinyldiaminopimelate aminotransferase
VSASVSSRTEELRRRWERRVLPSYATPEIAFVRGEGAALVDAEGELHLDFLSGLAVTGLGHAHPAVAAAVAEQARTLTHTSNLFITRPAVELAERLATLLGWDDGRTFLCNSGAEANEAALKLARRHGLEQHPDKFRVVTLEGSFHGRTLATLEATGQTAKHAPFAPLAGFVDHVPPDDPGALRRAVGPQTCAVMLEVIQGEGGVRPLDEVVLHAAREACDEHGALLIADEVQTGMGRTGSWFAWQRTSIVPDVVTAAKALANGLPIGACVAHGPASRAFAPGEHASTFGGNPVSCAAALAVIDVMERERLVERARESGAALESALGGLVGQVPHARGVRGRGLLLALELDAPVAAAVERACRDRYLIVNAVGADAVRLAPPLNVTTQEIELATSVLSDALVEVGGAEGT